MARSFLGIGPATMAVIALLTLGGCAPPLGPPPSAGTTTTANTTASPSMTVSANVTSTMPRPCDCLPCENPKPLSAEERIQHVLDQPISTPFVGRSLFDLAAYFRRSCSINLVIDQGALNERGIDGHLSTDLTLSDVSLGCLLDALLEPMDLTWTIRHETLTITTKEVAAGIHVLGTHDVTELVAWPEWGVSSADQCQALIETIKKHFAPTAGASTSADSTGSEWIEPLTVGGATVLIISHEYRVQRQIDQLLDQLRTISRQHATRP